MKRRKKVWIMCAALAVVLALYSVAFFNQPIQDEFLTGAQLMQTEVLNGPAGPEWAVRTYRSQGTLDTVADSVAKELLVKDGWRPYRIQNIVQFARSGESVTVASAAASNSETLTVLKEPGTVLVYVSGPPSAIDSILARLHLR